MKTFMMLSQQVSVGVDWSLIGCFVEWDEMQSLIHDRGSFLVQGIYEGKAFQIPINGGANARKEFRKSISESVQSLIRQQEVT